MSKHSGWKSRLRLAEAADAEVITRLINAAFAVERFFLAGDRIQIGEVRDRLAKGKFILAEQDGVIIGCVYVEPGGERAYLGLLSVQPTLQRSGIGKILMDAAEEHCRLLGCRFMDLRVVNLRTELPPYYRKLGYVQSGAMSFPEEVRIIVPCHLLIMSKPLIPPEIQP
ncbi:MAG TPA: GNAT family N-acetyltransferase [Bryobacteraceae bacterium]|nr:GNAT family N-acetyltransferase [Bryobacteraceae bacterium]